MIFFFLIIILFFCEILYFKIANRFNIIDKPNQRSAHSEITIRGGGILFWIAALFYFCFSDFKYPLFFFGLSMVAFISFLDDIFTLPNRYRLPAQFLAIGLALYEVHYFTEPYWVFGFFLVIGVGILNAYNFMDGINGITGGYSLIALFTLWIINNFQKPFIDNEYLFSIIAGVIVFNYFNFRKKAKCFAGDVGSVSMGLLIIFPLLKLIQSQNQYYYILILAVYGVDTVLTIIQRIIKRENIFKAHSSHFFQILARNLRIPHLHISGLYMFLQFCINIVLIQISSMPNHMQWLISISILIGLIATYLFLKPKYLKINSIN